MWDVVFYLPFYLSGLIYFLYDHLLTFIPCVHQGVYMFILTSNIYRSLEVRYQGIICHISLKTAHMIR